MTEMPGVQGKRSAAAPRHAGAAESSDTLAPERYIVLGAIQQIWRKRVYLCIVKNTWIAG